MKIITTLILVIVHLFGFNLIAQTKFSGEIREADTNTPIEGAIIQYGEMQEDYIISDKNGVFSIPKKHNDIIYIRRIGYLTNSILFDNLVKDKNVLLQISPIELNSVEITPIDVNTILAQSIINTKNKLIRDNYFNYLLHFKQIEKYSGEEQEIELKYAARLDKVKSKNLSYSLKKIDIKRIQQLPENATSNSLKKNIFNIEYHMKDFDSNYYLEKYKITKSDSSNDLLIFSASPKEKGIKEFVDYKFYISKVDTVLQAIHIDVDYKNSNDGYKSFGTRKYKINKNNTVIKFSQKEDGNYIFAEGLQVLEILIEYKNGHKEKIISFSSSKLMEEDNYIPQNINKLKKLNGRSKELFSK